MIHPCVLTLCLSTCVPVYFVCVTLPMCVYRFLREKVLFTSYVPVFASGPKSSLR